MPHFCADEALMLLMVLPGARALVVFLRHQMVALRHPAVKVEK